jgi:hypothetical protein
MELRIVGTPRSGTNLAKYLVETHLGVGAVFNRGFWKHGVFPVLMADGPDAYGGLPIVVLSRDPVSQVFSWYCLARDTGMIFGLPADVASFVSRPLTVTPDSAGSCRVAHRFTSPAAYWNQYYFALVELKRSGAPVHFVRYEDLLRDPAAATADIAAFLGVAAPPAGAPISLPEKTFSMTNDGDGLAGDKMLSPLKDFDRSRTSLDQAAARMGGILTDRILAEIDPDLLIATGRAGYRAIVEAALGRRPAAARIRGALRRIGL